jgi:hypothetical protein
MIVDENLLSLAESIDDVLMDACIKHQIGFEVITAIVLARIVAISQQLNSEADTNHLLSLAQSSIMETSNHTIQ